MLKPAITLLVVTFLATPVPGWRPLRWNITVAETQAAVPSSKPADAGDQDRATGPLTKVRLRTRTTFLGSRFAVFYEFSSGRTFAVERLTRISLHMVPYDGRRTGPLIRDLTSRYGAPSEDLAESGVRHVTWEHDHEWITLSEMKAETGVGNAPLLSIVFQPAPAQK